MMRKRISKLFFYKPRLLLIAVILTCVSNTYLFAQQNTKLSNNKYKMEVLQKIENLLATKYVLPELAKKYAKIFRNKYESGTYKDMADPKEFSEQVNKHLKQITNDKHFNFRVIEASDIEEEVESTLHHPIRYHRLGIKENNGFFKLEWLEGNIGYVDLRRFYYYSDNKEMIIGAIKFLANADAIIIDIRENGGGSGDYLSSYFLKHPTQLNSWYSREEEILFEYQTSNNIGMKPLTEVPLFLLTGKNTFSSAESFAYDLKVRKRAIIVGDSTKGGAHSVDLYKINDQFEIYIPTVRAINPVTGKNWEGTGVIPDVLVSSSMAFDTALVLAQKVGAKFAEKKKIKLQLTVKEMEKHLSKAETCFKKNKNNEGKQSLHEFFKIALQQNLVNEFFIDVLAYNYTAPEDEKILYSILKKKIDIFPNSAGAYENLAYAYFRNNKKEQAVHYFKKVLEIDPDNLNAIKMIQKLEKE